MPDPSIDASRPLLVEVGAGELVDKITILRIKAERMRDPARLANVRHELATLEAAQAAHLAPCAALDELAEALMDINGQLWAIEDDIRLYDKRGDFGPGFVALARAVYETNDRRAAVKKRINLLVGARIVEEKSYAGAA
ncbi:DUF6165 family protein [Lichenihabitans sp. Uapishka_5]|uniref:DUF6165 family protein n=1 Tax=Lichenihabitans sp. Uapishka_5 TaxID=3037302 RepID=UPI0029E818BA|nr:DUF6165 family protein [Lichenihabitans sp. Uapishka_5]MDX7953071.1 DUF6165 family protein [Lichenihabitans sp. Uapishka_5]